MTMGSLTLLFLISPLLTHLTRFTIAQPEFPFFICSDSGNYTSNSSYRANLDHLLSSFSSNTEINYGFYNFSTGEDTDKVYAIALCRGDVTVDTCRSCVNNSTHQLIQFCPNQKEAIVWYEKCMLRYSDQSIFGAADLNTPEYTWLGDNITNTDQFNQELGTLLADLKSRAASGGSLRKFASGEASVTSFQRIYALLQCTPDLNELACENCLQVAIDLIPNCCDRKPGGYILGPSCNLRWEKYSFFPSPTDATAPQGKKSNLSNTVIIIVVATVASLILIVCIYIFSRMRKPREKFEMDEIRSVESLQFDFETIKVATDNFSDANKLGQCGFGAVYKGRPSDGEDIAVKRLSIGSAQGEEEFKNEVLLVAKLQHRNLVRLLGFCLKENERLLIYEFLPNKSLNHFIFDPINRARLDWETRYKIIGGIVRGLLYLHEDSRLRIIHRDLKSSNILLDAEMNPKISDLAWQDYF